MSIGIGPSRLDYIEGQMADAKPYPAYTATRLRHLPQAPAHWPLARVSVHMREVRHQVTADWLNGKDLLYFSIPAVQEFGNGISESGDHVDSSKLLLTKPTLLVSKLNPRKATIVMAIPDKRTTVCSGEFVALQPFTCEGRFAEYLFRSEEARQHLAAVVQSATRSHQRASPQDVTKLEWAWPPLSEQRAIVTFLDEQTQRIDALIEKKRRLLDLLAEQRTALITQAVTKGLDPSASMKASGVDWLGDVPQHWEVWKTTHGFRRLSSGTTPKSDNLDYYDGDVPWVTTSELRETVIESTSAKVTAAAIRDYSSLRIYPVGTLLFAMYGATIGRLGTLGIPATVNQACCAFVGPRRIHTRFMYYWLLMRRPILIALSSGGGQPNLSQDDLREVRVPCPDVQEQEAIATYLDTRLAEYQPIETAIVEVIEKLTEYRQALISAAVTGRIDVRPHEASEVFA